MSDTNALRARIASELNRALTDTFGNSGETFATVVNREINAAVKHYESTRFRWNEVRESTLLTMVSGTRTYSLPADFIAMDALKYVYNGNYIPVTPLSYDEIERKDTRVTAITGTPNHYAIYGNVMRFFPAPNGAYTLIGSYIRRFLPTSLTGSFCAAMPMGGSYTLTVTTTASHNNRLNGWTTDGEELIRARAKAAIQILYLKNAEAIAEMQGVVARREPYLSVQEGIAFEALQDETFDVLATNTIKPYRL